MAAGIVQPDGTKCYSGPNCKLHGAHNRDVLTKPFSDAGGKVYNTRTEIVQGIEDFAASGDMQNYFELRTFLETQDDASVKVSKDLFRQAYLKAEENLNTKEISFEDQKAIYESLTSSGEFNRLLNFLSRKADPRLLQHAIDTADENTAKSIMQGLGANFIHTTEANGEALLKKVNYDSEIIGRHALRADYPLPFERKLKLAEEQNNFSKFVTHNYYTLQDIQPGLIQRYIEIGLQKDASGVDMVNNEELINAAMFDKNSDKLSDLFNKVKSKVAFSAIIVGNESADVPTVAKAFNVLANSDKVDDLAHYWESTYGAGTRNGFLSSRIKWNDFTAGFEWQKGEPTQEEVVALQTDHPDEKVFVQAKIDSYEKNIKVLRKELLAAQKRGESGKAYQLGKRYTAAENYVRANVAYKKMMGA